MSRAAGSSSRSTPLWAVLALTFLASVSTGVFWSGVPFIVKHEFAFTQQRTLMLSGVMGVMYMVLAISAARFLRVVERHISARSVLGGVLAVQGLACLLPVIYVGREWTIWVSTGIVSCLSALLWPTVESYLSAGRHGAAMRSAIGWFNITWTPAVAISLLLMALVLKDHASWGIGMMSVVSLSAIAFLPWFTRNPAPHGEADGAEPIGDEYPLLLRSSRLLLPISYFLVAAMGPILPFRFDRLGVEVQWETPATATWMIIRVAALALMWRLPFWHGRWGTLLFGGVSLVGGFAFVLLSPSLGFMLLGFAMFGIGMGVIYYASLYYALAVGRAAVDAGGAFEALIGAGYTVGPFAALLGIAAASDEFESRAIVGIVWAVVAVGCVPAMGAYVRAKKRRASQTPGRAGSGIGLP